MRRSSARQAEFDFGDTAAAEGAAQPVQPPTAPAPSEDSDFNRVNVFAGAFRPSSAVVAATARLAGRLNASTISEQEYSDLLRERQGLLDKKFEGTITRREENRLKYVRWSLDRIEDARHGGSLDTLESYVRQYQEILTSIQRLQDRMKDERARGIDAAAKANPQR